MNMMPFHLTDLFCVVWLTALNAILDANPGLLTWEIWKAMMDVVAWLCWRLEPATYILWAIANAQ